MAMEKCSKCKKNPVKSVRSEWCGPCYKARRTKQLKANNVVWRKRVAKKTAGHHVRYMGKPTEWAAENQTKALALAKKYKTGAELALEVLKGKASKPSVKSPKAKSKPQPKVKAKKPGTAKPKAKKAAKKEKAAVKAKPPVVRKAKKVAPAEAEPAPQVTAAA